MMEKQFFSSLPLYHQSNTHISLVLIQLHNINKSSLPQFDRSQMVFIHLMSYPTIYLLFIYLLKYSMTVAIRGKGMVGYFSKTFAFDVVNVLP